MSHEMTPATSAAEEARLTAAMARADDLLVGSLRAAEKRRHRNRILWFLGGLAMTTAMCFVLYSLTKAPAADGPGATSAPVVLAAAPAEKPATKKDPQQAAALTQAGWTLWQHQQLAPAIEKFQAALQLDPDHANALNGLGWAHLNGGEYAPARAAFEKLLAIDPKHAAALNGMGQMALAERDYEAAEKLLVKAAPNAPAAWYGLARVYLLTGKYDQATKWLRKIANTGDKDPALSAMLDAAKAKELPDSLRRQIEPPMVSGVAAQVADGWMLANQGRAKEAKAVFEKALAESPLDAAALNGMGWLLLNGNDPQAALPYFERALKADASAAGAMNGLGKARYLTDDVAGAIAIWQEMAERIPGVHAGTYNLADAYLETEQYDKAAPLLEQLAAAAPNDAALKDKLAKAKQQAGK